MRDGPSIDECDAIGIRAIVESDVTLPLETPNGETQGVRESGGAFNRPLHVLLDMPAKLAAVHDWQDFCKVSEELIGAEFRTTSP